MTSALANETRERYEDIVRSGSNLADDGQAYLPNGKITTLILNKTVQGEAAGRCSGTQGDIVVLINRVVAHIFGKIGSFQSVPKRSVVMHSEWVQIGAQCSRD